MDPSPSLSAQNLNTGEGTQNNYTSTGSQFNAHRQHFHLPPELLESPPSPSCEIPFPRDSDFVGRGTLLDQIDRKCSTPASRIALVGLGGVGKSQLAIEHGYRTADRSPDTWVFWVHASNAARFEQSYQSIANYIKVPGRHDPKTDIYQLLHNWLRDKAKGRWVLILDNVDDAGFLLQARGSGAEGQTGRSSQPLISYVPRCQHGSVLVTTRSMNVALQLVEQRDIIAVKPMDEKDAQMLLQKKLEQQDGGGAVIQEVVELALALEYIPLAIVQAAAYISRRWPRYTVKKYLEEFRRSECKRTMLLAFEGGQLRRDWEAKNSVIITWQISFDYIQQSRPSAGGLLALMSFFDRQGIPEILLRRPVREETVDQDQDQEEHDSDHSDWDDDVNSAPQSNTDDNGLENDILTLREYSLISDTLDGATFEMHSLVQLATRQWLIIHDQLERWKQQSISNLYAAFPTEEDNNWERCQVLFPHAKLAARQQPQGALSLKKWAALLYYAASHAMKAGDIADAKALAIQSMETRKKELGLDHEGTLWSMMMMANAYSLEGQYNKAETLEVEVVETRQKKLGVDHIDTLASIGNLATTYSNQGRWKEAEALEVKVMGTSKSKLGADHSETLISMANLASTYSKQGRWKDAEQLEVEVMETSKRKLGIDHPDTLISMNNLSATYREQGGWKDAEVLDLHVLEARKKRFGPDHPYTLTSMGNLASTYSHQGRWKEAEALEVEVMETCKKKFGTDYPDTLTSMNNLSVTYKEQERWEDAEALDLHVLEARKKKVRSRSSLYAR